MRRLTRLHWLAPIVLAVAACPQMMVYDVDGLANIDTETIETSIPFATAAPRFLSASVLGGTPQPIGAADATFDTDQLITLATDTEGATVYFTITPVNPNPYAGSDTFTYSGNSITDAAGDGTVLELRAIALKAQMYPSQIVTQILRINYTTVSTPTISPAIDTVYGTPTSVTLSTQTAGATIWYTMTTDGSQPANPVPGSVGTAYTGPIPVAGLHVRHTIRAVAAKAQMLDSGFVQGWYETNYAPTGLTTNGASATTLDVSWDALNGATGYQVYRDSNSAGPFTNLVYSGAATTFTDTALSGATTYYYRVLATSGSGNTALGAAVGGTTLPGPPATPIGLAISSGTATNLSLSWTASLGADTYEVYRDTSIAGPFTTLAYNAAGTSFTDTPLLQGVQYFYKVLARSAAGPSALSAPISGATAPLPPTGLVGVAASPTTMNVSWDASPVATTYEVYRDRIDPADCAVQVYAGAGTSFTDVDLDSRAATYNYWVLARNSSGASALSGTAPAVSTPIAPAPPSGHLDVGFWEFAGNGANRVPGGSSWTLVDIDFCGGTNLRSDGLYMVEQADVPIPALDFNRFTVGFRARSDAANRPIVVGGTGWRWMDLRIDGSNQLALMLNNFSAPYSTGIPMMPGAWHEVTVTFDIPAQIAIATVDNGTPVTIPLGGSFAWALGPPADTELTLHNFGNGQAFLGQLDWIYIGNGVLSFAQVVHQAGTL